MTIASSDIGARLTAVRDAAPLIQCNTNSVVMNFTANVILAMGCAPAMVDIPDEAGAFTHIASAALINLGTPYAEQRQAALEMAQVATQTATPWVLDPVAVGSLPVRTALAEQLLACKPPVIRGNPSEIIALAGVGGGGRGVDAVDTADDALQAAHQLAAQCGGIVAVSGATDIITDGRNDIRLSNGHVLLTQITGGGCALGAVIGAFAALDPANHLHAVAAAASVYTIAAERAADKAAGPGTFMMHFLDALATVTPADINQLLVAS